MKTTCKKSWPVNLCRTSCGFSILLTAEVVPKIFPNLNVVGHLAIPAGWGSCLPSLAIFCLFYPGTKVGDMLAWSWSPYCSDFLSDVIIQYFIKSFHIWYT